jgi:dTDP-4-amino-4,6-dideoxygalactose transaminase
MELPPDAEVALPSFSCRGVLLPILRLGLRPVFVDVDQDLNMSYESLKAVPTGRRLGAVILPHLGGVRAADRPEILRWAGERDIRVVEDFAQTLGSAADQPTSPASDMRVFSCGHGKPVFSVGGGWLETAHSNLAERIDELIVPPQEPAMVREKLAFFRQVYGASAGKRARRSILQASLARRAVGTPASPPRPEEPHEASPEERILLTRILPRLGGMVARQLEHGERLRKILDDSPLADFRLPPRENNTHLKMWICFGGDSGPSRCYRFRSDLWRHGVETEAVYVPLHTQPPYDELQTVPLPRTMDLYPRVTVIPNRPNLQANDWQRIERALRSMRCDN